MCLSVKVCNYAGRTVEQTSKHLMITHYQKTQAFKQLKDEFSPGEGVFQNKFIWVAAMMVGDGSRRTENMGRILVGPFWLTALPSKS